MRRPDRRNRISELLNIIRTLFGWKGLDLRSNPIHPDTKKGESNPVHLDKSTDIQYPIHRNRALNIMESSHLISPIVKTPFFHKKFTLFPKLPAELRLNVWNQIASTTRIVQTNFSDGHGPSDEGGYSPTAPPILLHINHESRYEALKRYTLIPLETCPVGAWYTSAFYLNPEIDTLFIAAENNQCLDLPSGQDEDFIIPRRFLINVKNLSLKIGYRRESIGFNRNNNNYFPRCQGCHIAEILQSFPRIEELVLVQWGAVERSGECRRSRELVWRRKKDVKEHQAASGLEDVFGREVALAWQDFEEALDGIPNWPEAYREMVKKMRRGVGTLRFA